MVLTVARGWRRQVRIAAGKAGAVGVIILVVPHGGESAMGRISEAGSKTARLGVRS